MSIQSDKFKKFLATGVMPTETSVLDEAISEYEAKAEDGLGDMFRRTANKVGGALSLTSTGQANKTLADHDKVFHKFGYKEGDKCKFRDQHPELVKADKIQKEQKDQVDDLDGASAGATERKKESVRIDEALSRLKKKGLSDDQSEKVLPGFPKNLAAKSAAE